MIDFDLDRLTTAFERIADALERQATCQEHAQELVSSTADLQKMLTSEMEKAAAEDDAASPPKASPRNLPPVPDGDSPVA